MIDEINQDKLTDYVNQGGNLYVESVNVGLDHKNTYLLNDILGVQYISNGSDESVISLNGSSDSPMAKNTSFLYYGGDDAHYSIDSLQATSALPAFYDENNYPRMFYHETELYKSMVSSVMLGMVKNAGHINKKEFLISEIINWFLGLDTHPLNVHTKNINPISNYSVFPNPFQENVQVEYTLERESNVRIEIFDIQGNCVKTLENSKQYEGVHQFNWDAKNKFGQKIPTGIYLYRMLVDDFLITKKIIKL